MAKKKSEHYVNNKELLEAMIVYRTKVEKKYKETYGKDLREQPKEERKPHKPLSSSKLSLLTHLRVGS